MMTSAKGASLLTHFMGINRLLIRIFNVLIPTSVDNLPPRRPNHCCVKLSFLAFIFSQPEEEFAVTGLVSMHPFDIPALDPPSPDSVN